MSLSFFKFTNNIFKVSNDFTFLIKEDFYRIIKLLIKLQMSFFHQTSVTLPTLVIKPLHNLFELLMIIMIYEIPLITH